MKTNRSAVIAIALIILGAAVPLGALVWWLPRMSTNRLIARVPSPSGAYIARIYNRSSVGSGNDYVTIATAKDDMQTRVSELTLENCYSVEWHEDKELLISCLPESGQKTIADCFVTSPVQWRDIKLSYRVMKPGDQ